jgi:hypothetical protein
MVESWTLTTARKTSRPVVSWLTLWLTFKIFSLKTISTNLGLPASVPLISSSKSDAHTLRYHCPKSDVRVNHIHIYIYTHTMLCINIYTHIHYILYIRICLICVFMCIYIWLPIYIYVCMHAFLFTMCLCACVHVLFCMFMYTVCVSLTPVRFPRPKHLENQTNQWVTRLREWGKSPTILTWSSLPLPFLKIHVTLPAVHSQRELTGTTQHHRVSSWHHSVPR